MKRYLDFASLMSVLLFGTFVLLLTTLPGGTPLVSRLSDAIGGSNRTDALGHVVLFAVFTLVLWFAGAQWMPSHYALLAAMGLGLIVGTGTEISQWLFITSRGATLADLMANWLGVFVTGFGVSYLSYIRCLLHSNHAH